MVIFKSTSVWIQIGKLNIKERKVISVFKSKATCWNNFKSFSKCIFWFSKILWINYFYYKTSHLIKGNQINEIK